MLGFGLLQILDFVVVVNTAGTVPQEHFTACHPVDIVAEVAVGHENDLLVLGQLVDEFQRVAGGDDQVALGLHRCSAVDIRQHLVVRVFCLEFSELLGLAAVGEGAARAHVGHEHLACGVEDFGRLRHEVHAGEEDDVGLRFCGLAGQSEAVAHEVGHLLHFGQGVIMRQDDGVLLALQASDFGFEFFVIHIAGDYRFTGPTLRLSPCVGLFALRACCLFETA